MKQWNIYWENRVKSIFPPRKVDKERITIGSCFANGFGLRICVGGVFFEKSSENVSNDIFELCVFS